MNICHLSLPILLPTGAECLRCIARLHEALMQIKGVEEASVNNAHDTIRITYDPNIVALSRLESVARRIGADIAAQIDHATVVLGGLDCPDCARAIERDVAALEGVLWIGTSFVSAQAHIEFERNRVPLKTILKRMVAHGVRPRVLDNAADVPTEPEASDAPPAQPSLFAVFSRLFLRDKLTFLAVFFAALGLITGLMPLTGIGAYVSRALYAAAILVGGWGTFRAAVSALRARLINMSVLMSLAVIGAAAIGDWGEAASVVVLFSIGNTLQAVTLGRTRQALHALMALAPQLARVVREGQHQVVPVSQVGLGETLLVLPGEQIPLDGMVMNGVSAVNESLITGEGLPVEKGPGAEVFAGTLNFQGALEVQVTRWHQDTTLSRIAHSVEEAQAQRAPTEQIIDRFARLYTPLALWLAVGVAFLPPLMAWGDFLWHFPLWFHRGLSLLIIACPCALVLSTPVAIVAAIGAASRRGVLIKSGEFLEAIGTVKAIVYDKTGTLTQGRPVVVDVVPLGGQTCAEILGVAATLERRSTHPLAQAICEEAERHPLAHPRPISDFEELPGLGGRALVEGVLTLVGNARLFQHQRIPLPRSVQTAVAEAEATGKTTVLVGGKGGAQGLILLSDPPRLESREIIAKLGSLGIRYQSILSGDSAPVVMQVAAALGIAHGEGGLLPEQKRQRLYALQEQYGPVAMIGDGVNDAPALAAANVGIAMGAAGSDLALEAADIAFLRDDLTALPFLINLSRRTRRIIWQNVGFSLLTKGVLLVGAALTTLPLWLAVLGDVGVSLLVTLNALRLNVVPGEQVEPQEEAPEAERASAEWEGAEPALELVFINDPSVDEQPTAGSIYPPWERFSVPFTGQPLRFGRRAPGSTLPIQIEDEAMSRVHGEFRMEGRRPILIDLRSTNGIRLNGQTTASLIPPERPVPLHFGDVLRIGRNTRIEIYPPASAPMAVVQVLNPAQESTRESEAKSGTTTGSAEEPSVAQ